MCFYCFLTILYKKDYTCEIVEFVCCFVLFHINCDWASFWIAIGWYGWVSISYAGPSSGFGSLANLDHSLHWRGTNSSPHYLGWHCRHDLISQSQPTSSTNFFDDRIQTDSKLVALLLKKTLQCLKRHILTIGDMWTIHLYNTFWGRFSNEGSHIGTRPGPPLGF